MPLSISKMMTIGILPNFLKIAYYKMRGAQIGKGVKIGFLSTIDADNIEIGDNAKIGMLVQIKARVFKMGSYSEIRMMTAIESPRVHIGNETIIMEQVIIGGMESWDSIFEIGDRCKVFPFCFINPTRPIKIGNEVGIGGANYLFTHGTWSNTLEGYPASFGPITLEDRVWLPWRVFVLPNVTIGHDSVIAAGSVVSKSIPPNSLAAGAPALIKKTGNDFVTPKTDGQKLETLNEIFSGFISFLRIRRIRAKIDFERDGVWHGKIVRKNKILGSIHVVQKIDSLDGYDMYRDCFISLHAISNEIRLHIEAKSCVWFDLKNYEWNGPRNVLSNEIRTFLSRYGIRFESLDARLS